MKAVLDKSGILKKTFLVGFTTLCSRLLGLARELLLNRFLGLTVFGDAFNTAFALPNSLRKVFAEGALTAAFVPTYMTVFKQDGKEQANKLTTLAFLFFESLLLVVCAIVMWKAAFVVHLFAPGYVPEQIEATIPCLRILMPFIFFISISSLLAGPLQAAHHFFVPAFGPVLLNIVFVAALFACMTFNLSVNALCFMILGAGALQCVMHVVTYVKFGFSMNWWNKESIRVFVQVMWKFLFCFFSMSIMEINFLIDQRFASYLPIGSVSLIKYANRFMGIPLGIFAVAFSTILLPHFSQLRLEKPEKMNFYLLESIKLVCWVTIPATLIMCLLSNQIFLTLFASTSDKFPLARVPEAGLILAGFLIGLCFFSLQKILFALFYAMHDTHRPTIIAIVATVFNAFANWMLIDALQGFGLSLATSLSGIIQVIMSLYFLYKLHAFTFQIKDTFVFLCKYALQVGVVLLPFYLIYTKIMYALENSGHVAFTAKIWFWLWATPLIAICFLALYVSRRLFGIELYFLD